HGIRKSSTGTPRRRAAAITGAADRRLATCRVRPRRSHRRGRWAKALRAGRRAVHVLLLHGRTTPVGSRGLPAHRGRPCLARAPHGAGHAGGRPSPSSGIAKLAPHLTRENRDALL